MPQMALSSARGRCVMRKPKTRPVMQALQLQLPGCAPGVPLTSDRRDVIVQLVAQLLLEASIVTPSKERNDE